MRRRGEGQRERQVEYGITGKQGAGGRAGWWGMARMDRHRRYRGGGTDNFVFVLNELFDDFYTLAILYVRMLSLSLSTFIRLF